MPTRWPIGRDDRTLDTLKSLAAYLIGIAWTMTGMPLEPRVISLTAQRGLVVAFLRVSLTAVDEVSA